MPLSRGRVEQVHSPGILRRIVDWIRGHEQIMVRAGDDLPLLLISYPRGAVSAAKEVEHAFTRTLRILPPETIEPYRQMLRDLPAMVVVLLRRQNVCGCLGHHHPKGTESRLTRRLQSDLGSTVGEIDLAYEAIRNWRPEPLAAMAAEAVGHSVAKLHNEAATLAVLLHEFQHLARPEMTEREVRTASNRLYHDIMEQLLAQDV